MCINSLNFLNGMKESYVRIARKEDKLIHIEGGEIKDVLEEMAFRLSLNV